MTEDKLLKYKELAAEVFRYLIVGGLAFAVDTGILIICRELIFNRGNWGIYAATTCGFIAGLAVNYILSIIFVFKNAKEKTQGKQTKSFLVFAVVGVIGLILTNLGMYAGVELLQIHYIITKVIVTVLVLAWNYLGRKILIFK